MFSNFLSLGLVPNWYIETSNSMLSEHSVRKCSDIDLCIDAVALDLNSIASPTGGTYFGQGKCMKLIQ